MNIGIKQLGAAVDGRKSKMSKQNYDLIIIGGGATGLGCAVEAASRGYSTLLLEACDYGKGTSSKSTKLVHGGIRYLANLDFGLVHEGLEERYYFLNNASHLAQKQSYLIPMQNISEKVKYWIGTTLYDLLAGKRSIGKSKILTAKETLEQAPDLQANKITGGAIYYDGQFDDTRMLITLVKTFEQLGGKALNYHQVTKFVEHNDKISGVIVQDKLTNQTKQFNAKVVINATGTFCDSILDLAEPHTRHQTVAAAQGTHLVFDKHIFDSAHAILVPKTIDGRVLFILPWHNKIVVGTTDVKVEQPTLEPQAQEQEIDFILQTLNQYSKHQVTRKDIKSVFCGQRPLVKPNHTQNTAKISRKHEIRATANGLISIVGGKWTIYRRMGQDTINFIENQHGWKSTPSISSTLKLFGATNEQLNYPLSGYGTAATEIKKIQVERDNYQLIHPNLPYLQAEIIYQTHYEHVKTIEDVLIRRTRSIFLDAKAAIEAAPLVAKLIAKELGYDRSWENNQVQIFATVAKHYLIK